MFSDGSTELTGNFWAQNTSTGMHYRVDAELLAKGMFCNVWVEKSSYVNWHTAETVAYVYDNDIHEKMLETFGMNVDLLGYDGKSINTLNTIQFADWLANGDKGDGKINILLLDIKDNYWPGVNESYVAGYFWAGNFFDNVRYSNKSSMIYIDTNPGVPGTDKSNATIAHEMQHLMNFVTREIKSGTTGTPRRAMDIWIDEGLSSAAEREYNGEHSLDRIGWYNNNGDVKGDIKGLIEQGNNFFVWGNHVTNNNPYPILDDYATVYLFFQWLRLQSNMGAAIYYDIITSENYDYNAVTSAANKYIPGNGFNNWETLLKTWFAANYINNTAGIYGYKNDLNIITHWAPANKSISLYPGEGVYSKTNSQPTITGQGINIRNAYLNKTPAQVNDSTFYTGGALLTYNVNTTKTTYSDGSQGGIPEIGTTTGAANVDIVPAGRFLQTPLSGPFAISAGDMLRLKGHEDGLKDLDLPKFGNGIIINE